MQISNSARLENQARLEPTAAPARARGGSVEPLGRRQGDPVPGAAGAPVVFHQTPPTPAVLTPLLTARWSTAGQPQPFLWWPMGRGASPVPRHSMAQRLLARLRVRKVRSRSPAPVTATLIC
ncbi:hypothetical protein AK812_SmicGene13491 [Symbiodinium microadriaticum]|uniref:Uncharacterized protein n=1 Tax=Symbiodinium microadriaticum TaxID=2951 RepID=A0A1Q9E820_SYMMI|nr:hypothetical protein AK812_SmicGene13491 [Symbiodinium microadriaticum]